MIDSKSYSSVSGFYLYVKFISMRKLNFIDMLTYQDEFRANNL